MEKSAITPNCGSSSSAVTLKMRSRSKTHKIYLTCLSNMSMKKKEDNNLLSLSLIRYMQKGSILLQFGSFSFAVTLTIRLRSSLMRRNTNLIGLKFRQFWSRRDLENKVKVKKIYMVLFTFQQCIHANVWRIQPLVNETSCRQLSTLTLISVWSKSKPICPTPHLGGGYSVLSCRYLHISV